MKEEVSWILKGPNNRSEELIFDDSEMSIQRDIIVSWINIITSSLIIFSLLVTIVSTYKHENRILFFFCVLSFAAAIVLFIMGILTYFKARKKNRRVYLLQEIKLVRSEIINKIIRITFEFNDGTKDKLSIVKTGYYQLFIEILKKNSIEIIENNKR